MNSIKILKRLNQHRRWVNANLITACESIKGDRLHTEFEMGMGSVWKTLIHMFAAEYVWFETLNGNEAPLVPGDIAGARIGNQLSDTKIRDLHDLKNLWFELEERWDKYFNELDPSELEEVVFKTVRKENGEMKLGAKRYDVHIHVTTHAHYHSAQLVNMLRHLGCDPLPQTMMISLAREEVTRPV